MKAPFGLYSGGGVVNFHNRGPPKEAMNHGTGLLFMDHLSFWIFNPQQEGISKAAKQLIYDGVLQINSAHNTESSCSNGIMLKPIAVIRHEG